MCVCVFFLYCRLLSHWEKHGHAAELQVWYPVLIKHPLAQTSKVSPFIHSGCWSFKAVQMVAAAATVAAVCSNVREDNSVVQSGGAESHLTAVYGNR